MSYTAQFNQIFCFNFAELPLDARLFVLQAASLVVTIKSKSKTK